MNFYTKLIFAAVVSISNSAFVFADETNTISEIAGQETQRVALVQMRSENVGNWGVVDKWVADAVAQGANFVIFPESAYLGWLNPDAFTQRRHSRTCF